MTAKAVEWVLVVRYLLSHHKAIYGRFDEKGGTDKSFSKDFIQLPRTDSFLAQIDAIFRSGGSEAMVPIIYKWPSGQEEGSLVFKSADRPHLSWQTKRGAPPPWRLRPNPGLTTTETIPGNPNHPNQDLATEEFDAIGAAGAGVPFLMAIKLKGEDGVLHLRAYLDQADPKFAWASTDLLPPEIKSLLLKTSKQKSTTSWEMESAPAFGILFDPSKNHDAWSVGGGDLPQLLDWDAAAETLQTSDAEVEKFSDQIEGGIYEVDDVLSMGTTRGSAQKAFAKAVKKNYKWSCAVSGISNRNFLVAAHIVPWSHDKSIRLDPSNGLCLSTLIDRAFELGFIIISDDFTVNVDWVLVGADDKLGAALKSYDGQKLRFPTKEKPKVEYLRRRRALLALP